MSKAFDEKYCHSCRKSIKKDNEVWICYDQSKDRSYIEKYHHKTGPTWISYFETSKSDNVIDLLGAESISTLLIGESKKYNSLSFTNTRFIIDSINNYKHFEIQYLYKENLNNQYPMLIDTNITQIKIKFSFDNGPEEIIREFKENSENESTVWHFTKIDFDPSELIRINLKTSVPNMENLLPKLLIHNTVTITIEIPESKDPGKLTRSITFDLAGFQKLYKKHSSFFN